MGRGLCPQENESLQWKHPMGGESGKLRNLDPTLGDRRDAARPHWAGRHYSQSSMFSVQYIGVGRRALRGIRDLKIGHSGYMV